MKIKSLNDSRFIAMSVYGTVIVSVTLTPIGFLLQHFPNVQYGIIGIMILSSANLILGLTFVTKVHNFVYFNVTLSHLRSKEITSICSYTSFH